jgi:adenosylhomocysteinase
VLRGGTEETTSGAVRLRSEFAGRVPFPILVINDSPLKQIVENKHAVGQSVVTSFLRITNLQPQGKRMMVFGYGWCGRGIAHYARALGAMVSVVEPDEIRALEAALDGFAVRSAADAAERGTVFLTATGAPGVLPLSLIERMPDGAILANAGHFDWEIDVPGLRARAQSVETLDHGIERFALPDGRAVVVLAGGRMVNLAGLHPKGNSVESMDLGFSLQALSLERVALQGGALPPGPQPVPGDIDRRVAAAMVAQMMGG